MTAKVAIALWFCLAIAATSAITACSAGSPVSLGSAETGGEGGASASGGTRGAQGGSQSGAGGTVIISGGSGGSGPVGCLGLQCQIDACVGRPKTSISGTVYDPAGRVPLYNVVVFVPNERLAPIRTGAECQTCDGDFSGKPVAVGLSGANGSFTVADAPSGDDIPLVIQVGKWRRQIVVPRVEPCTDTAIDDPNQTRLPRNQTEGHIPKIAIATGGSDALECLMRKIGLADEEFGSENGSGRVHLYAGLGAPVVMANGTPLSDANDLWSNEGLLTSYDMMLLSCEGDDNVFGTRSAAQYANVRRFADVGGRIFGSHWHHAWINPRYGAYPEVVRFASGAHGFDPPEVPIPVSVDTSFPKGSAFADWLVNVSASSVRGELGVRGAEHSVDTVVEGVAQRWIYGVDPQRNDAAMLQYFSFNTPVGAAECGRMVFSDLHVSAGSGTDSGKEPFPDGCRTAQLSPQEKALEFMLFDLSSCVQPDTATPEPPPVVR